MRGRVIRNTARTSLKAGSNLPVLHWRNGQAARRPPPQKRKSDLPAADAVASRAVLPKKRNPRQSGIFDAQLPAFIRPQLAKLVTEAPESDRWAHELKFDGYRTSFSLMQAATDGESAAELVYFTFEIHDKLSSKRP
jgi:ATP-dependent DNA ligase